MKKTKMVISVSTLFLFVLFAAAVPATDKEKEFQKISRMNIKELTQATLMALEKKYSNENWEKYKFPKYVYIHPAVTLGYKIAVKEHELLAKFPCYCMCEAMGHQNLFYCFVEKGIPGGNFDEHSSTCNICVTEAMRGFLWKDLGATEAEMLEALKKIYK